MKVIDTILPTPKTEKADWDQFINRIQSELRSHLGHGKRIAITQESEEVYPTVWGPPEVIDYDEELDGDWEHDVERDLDL